MFFIEYILSIKLTLLLFFVDGILYRYIAPHYPYSNLHLVLLILLIAIALIRILAPERNFLLQ